MMNANKHGGSVGASATGTSVVGVAAAAEAAQVLPAGVQAVLGLFDDELRALRFPDVDQAILREATAKVLAQADAVARAEAALAAAREGLFECQDALLGRCHRALAYARIFAEEDRELSRRLEAITLPRSTRTPRPTPHAGEAAESRVASGGQGRRGRRPASGGPTAGLAPLLLTSEAAPAPGEGPTGSARREAPASTEPAAADQVPTHAPPAAATTKDAESDAPQQRGRRAVAVVEAEVAPHVEPDHGFEPNPEQEHIEDATSEAA